MSIGLSATIDGANVPLAECDWALREPCGCVGAVTSAQSPYSSSVLATEDDAWHDLYEDAGHKRDRERAIRKAKTAGRTIALITREAAVTAFRTPCPHRYITPEPPPPGALFDPTDPAETIEGFAT